MNALETVSRVFDELGTAQIAKVCGVQYRTAYNWKPRKKFPARTFFPLRDYLHSKGLTAPPALWGLERAP